jgi:DNA-directed RNA polymerase subunit H (RpoH/RPB5)
MHLFKNLFLKIDIFFQIINLVLKLKEYLKMSQSFKELLILKRASLDLAQQRGFDITSEEVLRDEGYDDQENFRDLYVNIMPTLKDRDTVKFFEKEKINPLVQFRQYMSTYYPSKTSSNPRDGCVIFFAASYDNKKVSKEDSAYFCRMLEYFGVNNGIIISKNELNQSIEDLCLEYIPCVVNSKKGSNGCFIQHYLDEELKFNPLNHLLVPKHRVLSTEEFEQLNLKKDKLPVISALDPIAKRLGAKVFDVIEINRRSMISKTTVITEEEISYRVVKAPAKTKKK